MVIGFDYSGFVFLQFHIAHTFNRSVLQSNKNTLTQLKME